MREVYTSTGYEPSQVVKRYLRLNSTFEEGGIRVVEVNSSNYTIREYVGPESDFAADKIEEARKRDGTYPSWVEF